MLETFRNIFSKHESVPPNPEQRPPILNSSLDAPRVLVPSQDSETSKEQSLRRRALEIQRLLFGTTPPGFAETFREIFGVSPQTCAENIPRKLQEASRTDSYARLEEDMKIIFSLLAKATAETAYGTRAQTNTGTQELRNK